MAETLEIPATLHAQGRKALADAINLSAQVMLLAHQVEALLSTADVLTMDMPAEADGTCVAYRWNEATGAGAAQAVLIAIADNLGDITGSAGCYLAGESPHDLRERFADLLGGVE